VYGRALDAIATRMALRSTLEPGEPTGRPEYQGQRDDRVRAFRCRPRSSVCVDRPARLGASGHQGRYELREVLNAIFYQNRTGCQ
jgi:transposase